MKVGAIAFDSSSCEFVLSTFGYSVDKDGYIIHAESKERALAHDGKVIRASELTGITPKGLFRNNLASILELSDQLSTA